MFLSHPIKKYSFIKGETMVKINDYWHKKPKPIKRKYLVTRNFSAYGYRVQRIEATSKEEAIRLSNDYPDDNIIEQEFDDAEDEGFYSIREEK